MSVLTKPKVGLSKIIQDITRTVRGGEKECEDLMREIGRRETRDVGRERGRERGREGEGGRE